MRTMPTNLQAEPSYPGIDGMVMLSIRDPEWTGHLKHPECGIEEPHRTDECGLWQGGKVPNPSDLADTQQDHPTDHIYEYGQTYEEIMEDGKEGRSR